jgi:hypothetical protein
MEFKFEFHLVEITFQNIKKNPLLFSFSPFLTFGPFSLAAQRPKVLCRSLILSAQFAVSPAQPTRP